MRNLAYGLAAEVPSNQPTSDYFSNPQAWINYGVLGLMVIGFVTGWLWTKASVQKLLEERDRLIRERDKAYEQRDIMAEVLQEKLLPVVGEFVITTRSFLPILQQLQALQELLPKLQKLVTRLGSDRGSNG